jgi:hypothetical protein
MENTMNVKLAEALLRRKELGGKVEQLKAVRDKDLYEIKTRRQAIGEGIDDIIAQVPKITLSQVTAEYDFYARQLRLVDAAIQQANWTCDVPLSETVMMDFRDAEAAKKS